MHDDFKTFLMKTSITDDCVGEFITQARADPEFPQIDSVEALHAQFKGHDAELHDVIDLVWFQYKAWAKRQRRRARTDNERKKEASHDAS